MVETGVLVASTLIQLAATILAFRLVATSRWRVAGFLFALAFAFLTTRRALSLASLLGGTSPHAAMLSTELVELAISVLFVCAVSWIKPILDGIARDGEDLRSAEERYRDLVENTSDWIWEVDENLAYTYSSPRCKDLLGYDAEELLGRHPYDLMAQREQESVIPHIRRLVEKREPLVRVENVNVHKAGYEVVLETSGIPLFGADGQFLGYRGIDRDITEWKHSQDTLGRLNRTLRVLSGGRRGLLRSTDESEIFDHTCRVAVEAGGYRMAWVGIPVYDQERSVRVAACAGDDCGYVDQLTIRWDDSEHGQGPSGRAMRTGEPVACQEIPTDPRFEPWRDAAAAAGFASSLSVPIRLAEETIAVLNMYSADAHAFGPAEVSLFCELADDVAFGISALRVRAEKEALDELLNHRQRLEALGEVTGGIAHDFNNLLTVVLTNAQLIEDQVTGKGVVELLSELRGAAQSGAALIKRMLNLSRRKKLERSPVNLREVLDSTAHALGRLLPEDIEVCLTHQEGLDNPIVMADAGALEQVILNLTTNARDAMPDGGTLRIRLTETTLDQSDAPTHGPVAPGPYLCLSVEDNGEGMPEDVKERVFDPFFSTKLAGDGTGLGLAITYALIKQHHGFIDIRSREGEGTVVRVYLPTDNGSPEPEPSDSAPLVGGPETILVVDDSDGVRRVARRCLEHVGYKVVTAETGDAALSILEQPGSGVDLVLTDLRMPSMGGLELYSEVRKRGFDVPFLVTSGYFGQAEDGHLNADDGSGDQVPFIEKPWNVTDLVDSVRRVLDGRTLEPQS